MPLAKGRPRFSDAPSAPARFDRWQLSAWALLRFARVGFFTPEWTFKGLPADPVPWVAVVLVGLATVVLIEAVLVFRGPAEPPQSTQAEPITA